MLLSFNPHPIISCNYPSRRPQTLTLTLIHKTHLTFHPKILNPIQIVSLGARKSHLGARGLLQIRRDSSESSNLEVSIQEKEKEKENEKEIKIGNGGNGNWNDWVTSGLLFGIWAGLMYYIFQLSPDQTPYRDMYFLQKLLNLKGDDGFVMNQVLVALWYIMGLWPLVYSMLLLPTGRSSRSKIPVWPFLIFSCFGGAYALIPYFVLWKPPPPPIEEQEISQFPMNFLESKITAAITLVTGLGLIGYAGIAGGDMWKEFYQYFRESKFIHATCIDFSLLSTFAPFWVYNDITARRWINKGYWLIPLSLIPLVGPTLYILLRPPLSSLPMRNQSTSEDI